MRPRTQSVLVGGLVAGLIGYATVVVFFGVLNLVMGRSPFYTAALLGTTVFYGGVETATFAVTPGPVLAYNGLHMVVFLGLGTLASWFVVLGERYPLAQYLLFTVLVFVAIHVFAGMVFFTFPLLGSGAWWQVGIASGAAAVLMGWYLLAAHPLLLREMRDLPWDRVPGEL